MNNLLAGFVTSADSGVKDWTSYNATWQYLVETLHMTDTTMHFKICLEREGMVMLGRHVCGQHDQDCPALLTTYRQGRQVLLTPYRPDPQFLLTMHGYNRTRGWKLQNHRLRQPLQTQGHDSTL